jgi:hypothetical protein
MADSKEGHLYLMFDGYFGRIRQPYNCALWMFFLGIMLSTVVVLPLQYIYRYCLICRKMTITTKQFVGMFLAAITVIVGHCVAGQMVFAYNERPEIQERFGLLLMEDRVYVMEVPVFTVLDKVGRGVEPGRLNLKGHPLSQNGELR